MCVDGGGGGTRRGGVTFLFSLILASVPPLSAARQRRTLCKRRFNDAACKKTCGYIKIIFFFTNAANKTGVCEQEARSLDRCSSEPAAIRWP